MAERKSIHHGLTSDGHGPEEHGLGGLPSPVDPRDFAVADHPGYAAALATTFPTAWLAPNTPPISNQGATPQCVAYSSANDQGHMDRPESGLYPAYDRSKFFAEIGGPNGAYVRSALPPSPALRLPAQGHAGPGGGAPDQRLLPRPADSRRRQGRPARLAAQRRRGRRRPLVPQLVRPGGVGQAAAAGLRRRWLRLVAARLERLRAGAFRGRNSWGAAWGLAGDLPHAYLPQMVEIWRTLDRGV